MVKLRAPALGRDASGSLAGQVIFSTWKGKPYVKKHTKPKQPRTPKQVSMRAMMAFLSKQWSGLADVDQATWQNLALASQISPFNAYQKENLKRWRNYQAPSNVYPATQAGTDAQVTNWRTICLGFHAVIGIYINNQNDGWGVAFAGQPQWPHPDEWQYLLHVEPIVPNVWLEYDYHPTVSGSWHFSVYPFTTDGKFHAHGPYEPAWCAITV